MKTERYKVNVIKGENCTGLGIEKLNDDNNVIALASIYVDEVISFREGYRRAIKYIASEEGKDKRLLISIPNQLCNTDTMKMLRRVVPTREVAFRALPRALYLTTPLLAYDAIDRKTTITERGLFDETTN